MSEATLGLRVILEDGASSGLGALGVSFMGLYGTAGLLARAWSTLSPTTKALGITAAVSGIAFGGLAELMKSSVEAAAQLEQEMVKVQITVNGAADAGDGLQTSLVHIADTSIYTTAQVADAFSQLGIDGWNATQIMSGLGQTTIDFAEAAQTQTVPAALLLGSSMKMFGASASDAKRYADDLTFAMYNGQKSATNLQQAINQVGPVAHELGVNFNDLSVALAYMGEKGYYGTRAGTALRYMLSGLLDPSDKAKKEMTDLGLATFDTAGELTSSKFFDAQGNFRGIANAVDVLGHSLDTLNPQQRAEALAKMFSVRGGQGALLLLQNYQQTLASFGDLSGIENATSVTDKAAKITGTFNGALTRVKTTWNDFKAMLGQSDLGPLKSAFNALSEDMDKFNVASPAVHTFVGTLLVAATAGSGILFLATSLGFMVRAAKELGAFKELGLIGTGFSNLLGPARDLMAVGKGLGESFGGALLFGLKSLPSILGNLPDLFMSAKLGGSLLLSQFGQMASALPGLVSGMFSGGLGLLKSLPSLLMSGFSALPELFSSLGAAALGALPAVGGIVAALLPIILIVLAVAGVIAIVVLMFTLFRKQTMDLWSAITGGADILNVLKSYFTTAFGEIKRTWNDVWPQIQPAMKQLFDALHQMVPLFQLIGVVIGAVLSVILAVIVGLVNGFLHALPFIIGFFTGIFQIIGGVTQLIIAIFTGKWGSIPGILGGIFGGIVKVIIAPFQVVWAFIGGFIGGIIGFFQHLFDVLLGHSIIPDIVNGAVRFFQMMSNIVVGIMHVFIDLFLAPVRLLQALFSGQLASLVVNAVMHIGQLELRVLQIMLGLPGKFADIGKNIITSLIRAITSGAGLVGDALKNMATNALNGFKHIFGIASPSKVMMELGGHLSDGVVLGVKSVDVAGQATKHWAGITGSLPNARAGVSVGTALSNAASANAASNGGTGDIIIPINIDGRVVGQVVVDRLTGTLKQNGAARLFR